MSATTAPLQARIVKPEEASPLKAFGLDLKVLLTTEATGGAVSVLMGWHKPGEGPSDHVHFSQEEMFFIVEGTYELTVGDQTTTAGPGTIASSRATWYIGSRTSVRRLPACSTGACRADRTCISKRWQSSPPGTNSPAKEWLP